MMHDAVISYGTIQPLPPSIIAVGSDVSDGFVDWIELDHSARGIPQMGR